MNLAIFIGVSKYNRPVSDLPACKNDVDLMGKLIRKTGKFSDVLEFASDTSSAIVKTELAQFLTKHRDEAIDELLFYYTGHGDLYQNDFHFLFSDFTENRRNQTSLTNEELDAMIRPLNPTLTIKVVDACHAGITYVKEADALSKQLYSTIGRLNNCYFMFSSQSSQSSFQDAHLSDFTESFVQACVGFTGNEIRYKDVIDHISDAFSSNTEQTPTFVIQSSCTEIFCSINNEIKDLMPRSSGGIDRSNTPDAASSAIAQAIKTLAADFCTKEEAMSFINGYQRNLEEQQFSKDLKDFYDLSVEVKENYVEVPDIASIGRWLDEHKGHDYFARPTGFAISGDFIARGIDFTTDSPYRSIKITALPKVQNLLHGVAFVVFVFSKREMVFFYNFQSVNEVDWGQLAEAEDGKWKLRKLVMKKDLTGKAAAVDAINQFEIFLIKVAQETLGLKQEEQNENEDTSPASVPPAQEDR